MKNILVVLGLIWMFLVACNYNDSNQKSMTGPIRTISKEEHYSKLIDSLNIGHLINKTKWALYCLHCDDTIEFTAKSEIQDTLTYASLDLRLDTIMLSGDSIEIDFRFYYKDIPCDINLVYDIPIWGIRYTQNSDSSNCYTTDGTARYFWTSNPNSRFLNLYHPDVIKYINANKEKLHPWFLKEAKRRGVLK